MGEALSTFGRLAGAAAVTLACTNAEPSVAQNFELSRFQGHWYEVARVPRDYDRTCFDTTADYTLVSSGELELRHRCHLGSPTGSLSDFAAPATVDDPEVPAKLTLDLGLYRGSYWVLEVGKDYEYALIGHPSLTMLWVLARTPTLSGDVYAALRAKARLEGYDPDALVLTPTSH